MKRVIYFILLIPFSVYSQNYTSYFTGNSNDIVTSPSGGICLMGGATEDDNAMKWFLQRANGGDVLVLRTSGSNGYNNYLYSTLGIPVNSVETIVCNNAMASYEPYVLQKIQQAEAIWFAGGDQWTYVSFWRNTPVAAYINEAIQTRNVVIGGTSAGMAIQGKFYFTAQFGTITSANALANPYNSSVTVDSASFINNIFFNDLITDTHFDNPDRRGRLVTFLARIQQNYGVNAKAVACDEYTAVCIDPSGIAKVYGGYPTYDDNAYFVQINCELPVQTPELCVPNSPLTWNLNGQAVKVYRIKGNSTASNSFNLNNWSSGSGGAWLNWSVNNGVFTEQNGNPINCNPTNYEEYLYKNDINVYPNPAKDIIKINFANNKSSNNLKYSVYNSLGQKMQVKINIISEFEDEIFIGNLKNGIYYVVINDNDNILINKSIIKE